MAKKRGGNRRVNRSATRRRRETRPATSLEIADQPLVQTIRESMRSPDSTTILVTAAMVASIAIAKESDELPEGWVGLIQSFLELDIAETTVVLHLVAG